jgi:ABC-2 type transport system permease protein
MNNNKKRSGFDLSNNLNVAIVMTLATIRQLLFSKKTIGIIPLCLVPILIFSLWSADAFPKDTEVVFEDEYASIFDLEASPTDPELEILFDTHSVEVETSVENGEKVLELKISGLGTFPYYHSIDHLSLKVYLYLSELYPINLAELFNDSINGYIIGPIETQNFTLRGTAANGINDWREWELILRSPLLADPVGYIQDQLAENQPPGAENFQNLLEQADIDIQDRIRLGLYVRGFNDNITTEQNWTHDYIELYPIMDGNLIKDFGVVGIEMVERTIEEDGYEIFMNVATTLYFFLIIPLITILYSISAVRDDIENHTIVYLITRPVSKSEILLYKFKGYFISSWVLITISMVICFFIVAFREGTPTTNLNYIGVLIGVMTLTLLAYGAIFFVFATLTSYPIVVSLIYVFFYENFVSTQWNYVNRFSVSFHIQSIADGLLGDVANVFLFEKLSATDSFMVLIGVIIVFFLLACYIFNNRDFT